MNLICFSHLRWNFAHQRPQHVLSRFAEKYTVFYVEEAEYSQDDDGYHATYNDDNVTVIIPHLNADGDRKDVDLRLTQIISSFIVDTNIEKYFLWFYTPMALRFSTHLRPQYVVYDCMDELGALKHAPQELKDLEASLIEKADVIFTNGNALYNAKKNLHNNIYSFPSSIDKKHFGSARNINFDVEAQKHIPHPRLGFFGVIDERFDIDLIEKVAIARPDWHFVIIGPVVKIDPEILPKNHNIHYLGSKNYNELPEYIASWDIALIPFAISESTTFVSPTKTPEYLAAGKPVVSSAITDVIRPYGIESLVHIYTSSDEFITQVTQELAILDKSEWLKKVDDFLLNISWDITCEKMNAIVTEGIKSEHSNFKNVEHNV